jgi:hypothetical protein
MVTSHIFLHSVLSIIIINNIMVDHKICSDHVGIFRSHLTIFSLGVRRFYILWVNIQLLCGIFCRVHPLNVVMPFLSLVSSFVIYAEYL